MQVFVLLLVSTYVETPWPSPVADSSFCIYLNKEASLKEENVAVNWWKY